MDLNQLSIVVFRLIHIISGVLWVGSIAFLTLILEPHYRRQGTHVLRKQMVPLLPIMGPFLLLTSFLTFFSGIVMISIFGFSYLTTSMGQIILFGAGVAVLAFIVGDVAVRIQRHKLERLGKYLADKTLEGDLPGEDDKIRLEKLDSNLWFLGRTNFILLIIALGAMASARYL